MRAVYGSSRELSSICTTPGRRAGQSAPSIAKCLTLAYAAQVARKIEPQCLLQAHRDHLVFFRDLLGWRTARAEQEQVQFAGNRDENRVRAKRADRMVHIGRETVGVSPEIHDEYPALGQPPYGARIKAGAGE